MQMFKQHMFSRDALISSFSLGTALFECDLLLPQCDQHYIIAIITFRLYTACVNSVPRDAVAKRGNRPVSHT